MIGSPTRNPFGTFAALTARLALMPILGAILTALSGCLFQASPKDNPSVREIRTNQIPSADSAGFYYLYPVYTHVPYLGYPDSRISAAAIRGRLPPSGPPGRL